MMIRPTTGSAHFQPRARPPTPSRTASEVKPSARACSPVGDKSSRPDSASDPNAVGGDELVPGDADDSCQGHCEQVGYRPRARQAGHRLPGRRRTRHGHEENDDDAGQVLGPPVTVGVPPRGGTPAGEERYGKGNSRQGVRGVMQGVAEQGHRSGDSGHHSLDGRGRHQDGQGEPQRPHTRRTGVHRCVDLVRSLVRVRPGNMHEPVSETSVVLMAMFVSVAMIMSAEPVHATSMPEKSHCSTSTTTTRRQVRESCNSGRVAVLPGLTPGHAPVLVQNHSLALVDEAKQDMLRRDVVVTQHPGLFLCQDYAEAAMLPQGRPR